MGLWVGGDMRCSPPGFSWGLGGHDCGFSLSHGTPCPCPVSLCFPGPAVAGEMAFTPLKPPRPSPGEGLCGCWLQPQRFRAWFQPCLWRPIFNIKTNQCKWNLYYLLKTQVNRVEDSASRKPLGFVQGITTNILHPFRDFRQPQEVSAEDSCWNTPGCIADWGVLGSGVWESTPLSPNIPHSLKAPSNFQSQAGLSKQLDSIFHPWSTVFSVWVMVVKSNQSKSFDPKCLSMCKFG